MSEELLLKKIDSMERMLKQLVNNQPKPQKTWVKASVIIELTGKDGEWLRMAREREYILSKKIRSRVYEYLLESLNPVFIKKAPAVQ